MTSPRFLWIPQGFCHRWLWGFASLSCFIYLSRLRLSSASCCVLSWPVSPWFILLDFPWSHSFKACVMKLQWSCGESGGVHATARHTEMQHSICLLATWGLARLELVTSLCGDQSLYVCCLLSASRLPTYLPASCFPSPFRSSIYPSLLCRSISQNSLLLSQHRKTGRRFRVSVFFCSPRPTAP